MIRRLWLLAALVHAHASPVIHLRSGSVHISQTAPIPECPEFRRAQTDSVHKRHMVLVVLQPTIKTSKVRLADDIPGLRLHEYIPEGAWIAAGDVRDIHRASVHPRVRWIGSFSARHRIHPELSSPAKSHRWGQGSNSSEQVTLFASIQPDILHPNATDMAQVRAAAQSWEGQVQLLPWVSSEIRISVSSLEKVVVTCSTSMIFNVSKWLSELAPVKWVNLPIHEPHLHHDALPQVEVADKIVPHNRNARWLVQTLVPGDDLESEPLWYVMQDPNDGSWTALTGEDTTIAIADTGVDVHNCFFRDEARVVKYSNYDLGTSPSTEGLHCVGTNCHRKIKAYWNYMDSVDEAHGHGTYIAGAAAAGAMTSSNEGLAAFDSTAKNAKLLVMDIGCNGNANCTCSDCDCARKTANEFKCLPLKSAEDDSLHPPDDWNARLFPWSYENGAKIFVAAWGDGGPLSVYNRHAAEIDKFAWEHQDFLPIFSAGEHSTDPLFTGQPLNELGYAGNDGEKGFYTISPAATAKNALTLRDQLIEEHCTCGECHSEACQKALKLVPHWDTNNTDNVEYTCCTNSVASQFKAKCCPEQYRASLKNENFFHQNKLSEHNLQSTSSRGPTVDNRIKPDIVVIGEQVVSAKAGSALPTNGYCTTASSLDQCAQESGTSVATGVAASMAAVAREYLVKGYFPSGQQQITDSFEPSAAIVKAILIAGAVRPSGMVDLNGKGHWAKFSDGVVSPKDITDGFDGRPMRWAFDLADPIFALRSAGWPGTYGPSYFYGFGRLEASRSLVFRRNVYAKMHVWMAGDSVPTTTDCGNGCRGPYYKLVSVNGIPGRERWLLGEDAFCPANYKNANTVIKPKLGVLHPGLTYCLQKKFRTGNLYEIPITTGEAHARCLRVGGNTKDVCITLVWTDYPASSSSATALVNDLDLEVIFDGNILRGNALTQRDIPSGDIYQQHDRRNNVERVTVPQGTFTAGTSFMVIVKGYNIPQEPQGYALVVTGEDVFNTQENVEEHDGVHATPSAAYVVCPECVSGTRRPCDEFNKYYPYGTISDQICASGGVWAECTPYKCLRGFIKTTNDLGLIVCEQWLDEKFAGQSTDEQSVASRRQSSAPIKHSVKELPSLESPPSKRHEAVPNQTDKLAMIPQQVGPLLPKSARFMHDSTHMKIVREHGDQQLHQYFANLKNTTCVDAVEQLAGKKLRMHSHTRFYLTLNTSAALLVSTSPCVISMEPYPQERRLPHGRIPQPRAARNQYELLYIRPAYELNASSLVEKWLSHDGFLGLNASIQVIDKDEILGRVASDHLKPLVEWLIYQPEVRWIEQHSPKVVRSKYIRWISQTNNPTIPEGTGEIPYTDIDLDGNYIGDFNVLGDPPQGGWKYQGEIYAVVDTGIDYQHCMFYDETQATPLLVDDVGTTLEYFFNGHRKIIAYWTYMDNLDDDNGHGTHSCSLLVGSLQHADTSALSDYVGLTTKAKLYFMDVGCSQSGGCECTDCDCLAYGDINGTATCPPSSTAVRLPFNFYKEEDTSLAESEVKKNSLLYWAMINKVDVIVLPWGPNTTDQVYGREAADLDHFIWNQQTQSLNNPQITVIIAAGDDGLDTAYSGIRGAALAKNAIVVAASQTSPEAYKQAVEQFCEQGSAYDSIRTAEFQAAKKRLQKELCSCKTNHYDPDRELLYTGFLEPSKDMCQSRECAVVDAMQSPDDCCGTQYAEYCCKFSKINLTSADAAVPNLPGMKPYGLDNSMTLSGRGPINDGRIIPHISAPGMVSSARSRNEECNYNSPLQSMIVAREGSSIAAAHVAALVGIIRQYFRNGYYPSREKSIGKKFGGFKWSRAGEDDFTPSAALVKAMLLVCAVPLKGVVRNRAYTKEASWSKIEELSLQWGSAAPSYVAGMGRPQLNQCLPLKGDQLQLIVGVTKVETHQANRLELFEPSIVTQQSKAFCFKVRSSLHPVRIAIAWTDPPGEVQSNTNWNDDSTNSAVMNSEKVLMNDIDLEVLGGGQNRTGNELFRPNVDTGKLEPRYDRENNFEFIAIPTNTLVAGHRYRVKVSGFAIRTEADEVKALMGQRYSLVVVGDITDRFDAKDEENCPACFPGETKRCVVPSGCRGSQCQGRGTQSCNGASLFGECSDITCYRGFVPVDGAPPDNFCVNYTKATNRYMLQIRLRLTGRIGDFGAAHFESTVANFFRIVTNRIHVTSAVAGSVVVSFNIIQNGTDSAQLYEFQDTIMLLNQQAIGTYYVEEVLEVLYYDSLPPPPPCDLDFWVFQWCDAKYWSMWISIWIGCFIILLGIAVFVIKKLQVYYDKSLTPGQARQSIKMALAKNAIDTVAWATKDTELREINLEQYQYARLGEFFRVWAFGDPHISKDDFQMHKSFVKAFLYWKDKNRTPGLAPQNDRAWDMMLIGQGKLGLAVNVELTDFGKQDWKHEREDKYGCDKNSQYADYDTSNQENVPLKYDSEEEIAILDTVLKDDDIELLIVAIDEYGPTNFPKIFNQYFNGQRPYAQDVVLDCFNQLTRNQS